jgi:hypothetical protein
MKPAKNGRKSHSPSHPKKAHSVHHGHSPFFLVWELVTGACVMFVMLSFFVVPSLHLEEEALHEIHRWELTAEIILIVEVSLLLLVARNKIHFIRTKWATILAVLPFGGGFQFIKVAKIGWHAFEKTKLGHYFAHPIRSSKRWAHAKLGLRI